jgi:uncharacterized membrane protein
MLIILIIVVVGLYLMKENGRFNTESKNEPLKRLKERYINDEIDEEEYLKKKKILEE